MKSTENTKIPKKTKKKAKAQKPATDKKPKGRPSKKDGIDLCMLTKLAEMGLTIEQIAEVLNINADSLYTYQKDPIFSEAIKKGKEISDNRVKRSLFERATGYSHPDVDIRVCDHEIVKTPIIKHYPPDTAAAIFWLKNRLPDEWKDKHEYVGKDDGPLVVIRNG